MQAQLNERPTGTVISFRGWWYLTSLGSHHTADGCVEPGFNITCTIAGTLTACSSSLSVNRNDSQRQPDPAGSNGRVELGLRAMCMERGGACALSSPEQGCTRCARAVYGLRGGSVHEESLASSPEEVVESSCRGSPVGRAASSAGSAAHTINLFAA